MWVHENKSTNISKLIKKELIIMMHKIYMMIYTEKGSIVFQYGTIGSSLFRTKWCTPKEFIPDKLVAQFVKDLVGEKYNQFEFEQVGEFVKEEGLSYISHLIAIKINITNELSNVAIVSFGKQESFDDIRRHLMKIDPKLEFDYLQAMLSETVRFIRQKFLVSY